MSIKMFDLNIEEMLENWEIEHGLREIIANALDEHVLSKTANITISKDLVGNWHIRDYGRGLQIDHFTLNENPEKLNASSGIIGKFGVGLKDALATLHRHGINVTITSRFGTFRLTEAKKHNFGDITTLHIEYDPTPNDIIGTDFTVIGVRDHTVDLAKAMFLRFSDEVTIENTQYGDILANNSQNGKVYISGVFASEEPNFLFSYNITNLTEAMRKKLNRERLNVGRTTYSERIKAILRQATSPIVEQALVNQVRQRSRGTQCDEMGWIEISQKALNLMNMQDRVVYFTEQELHENPHILDSVQSDGFEVVIVTEQQKSKLEHQMQSGGDSVRIIEQYIEEFNASFQYKFIDPTQFNDQERRIFSLTPQILALVGITHSQTPTIRISETMRLTNDHTEGVWDSNINAIVIKRNTLRSVQSYAGVLLHELAHQTSGTRDATRDFERVLTNYLGMIAANHLHMEVRVIESAPETKRDSWFSQLFGKK